MANLTDTLTADDGSRVEILWSTQQRCYVTRAYGPDNRRIAGPIYDTVTSECVETRMELLEDLNSLE